MASELRVNTLKDAAGNNSIATSFVAGGSAKAWAETASDGASILGSFGFSSITDTATGQQQMNLSNAMTNVFYSRLATLEASSLEAQWTQNSATTSFIHFSFNGSAYADAKVCYGVMGDLA